jgi:hypothetical protein
MKSSDIQRLFQSTAQRENNFYLLANVELMHADWYMFLMTVLFPVHSRYLTANNAL